MRLALGDETKNRLGIVVVVIFNAFCTHTRVKRGEKKRERTKEEQKKKKTTKNEKNEEGGFEVTKK